MPKKFRGLKVHNIEKDVYFTYFGRLRIGDVVGVCAICELIRQATDKKFKLYVDRFPYVEEIMDEFSEYIVLDKELAQDHFPYSGNIWTWWDYMHRFTDVDFKLPNRYMSDFEENSIAISPLFDKGYNREQNWSQDVFRNLVNIALMIPNMKVYVLIPRHYEINATGTYEQLVVVRGDLKESYKKVASCNTFIGGDTGLTHIASSLQCYPKKVVAIHGYLSQKRRFTECRDGVQFMEENYLNSFRGKVNTDFLQRPNSDKKLLYVEMNEAQQLSENNYTGIKEFIIGK